MLVFILAGCRTGAERWLGRRSRDPRVPSDAVGCALGAKHRLAPCPCEVGRGRPLSNDAAKIKLLMPQKHPAVFGAACTALPLLVLIAELRRFS